VSRVLDRAGDHFLMKDTISRQASRLNSKEKTREFPKGLQILPVDALRLRAAEAAIFLRVKFL